MSKPVILFTPPTWKRASGSCERTLFTLYNIKPKLGTLSVSGAFKLFNTLTLSIHNFAAVIWDTSPWTRRNKFIIGFSTKFLRFPRYTYSALLWGKVGRSPLCFYYYSKIIKF